MKKILVLSGVLLFAGLMLFNAINSEGPLHSQEFGTILKLEETQAAAGTVACFYTYLETCEIEPCINTYWCSDCCSILVDLAVQPSTCNTKTCFSWL